MEEYLRIRAALAEHSDVVFDLIAVHLARFGAKAEWSMDEVLDATETFQKNLFTLKKKVIDTHWLISLGKIPSGYWPRLLAHEPLARGALQEVLPGLAPPPGLVQAAFASRQGMRPAVRQLLDALAAGFDALVREGRCLRVTAA